MTPKEQYEARKAERHKRREAREVLDAETTDVEFLDLFDRIATACERIADNLEQEDV